MSTEPEYAIDVSHVSKSFKKHHRGSLKYVIMNVARRANVEPFTALSDVTFSVDHGETVAVIGRNGSGKSTLLSLLARVLRPTSGTVQLFGRGGKRARVAPLLELGAGFHPDLIGLDNILFYGAMLGMSERELNSRLDEIVEFSEVRDKVDVPVREWNDGSKLRLGFAIAVHTDPDILLIDEVLAVGDEEFRNKCYRKIAQLQASGATIVFVSHDLEAVERVADRSIWIDRSLLRMDGPTSGVVRAYRDEVAYRGQP